MLPGDNRLMQADPLSVPPDSVHTWDIFCQVIDNFGDVGVCWRLSADLAARGHTVRLWLDDPQALRWMAPGAMEGSWPGITVRPWHAASDGAALSALGPAHVWVESFGCQLPPAFVAARAQASFHQAPVWINLEYLSAEAYAERCHGLPSPLMSGPAKGWTKYFFYPGFTPGTGGLLREPGLIDPRSSAAPVGRRAWLQSRGVEDRGETLVSLFCYASAPVDLLLAQLASLNKPVHLLVTAGQAARSVEQALALKHQGANPLRITYVPLLPQTEFDALLCACDLNFVRGEDSLVRALWAGRPFIWQIYPQDDGAHRAKLQAFLETLDAPAQVRAWHAQWNWLAPWDARLALPLPLHPTDSPASHAQAQEAGLARDWLRWARALPKQLAHQTDLTSQLCGFVEGIAVTGQQKKTR
jgi:uncharacterized repeat protein (TIGR03837 family)